MWWLKSNAISWCKLFSKDMKNLINSLWAIKKELVMRDILKDSHHPWQILIKNNFWISSMKKIRFRKVMLLQLIEDLKSESLQLPIFYKILQVSALLNLLHLFLSTFNARRSFRYIEMKRKYKMIELSSMNSWIMLLWILKRIIANHYKTLIGLKLPPKRKNISNKRWNVSKLSKSNYR